MEKIILKVKKGWIKTLPNPASFNINRIPTDKFQNANHMVHFITEG